MAGIFIDTHRKLIRKIEEIKMKKYLVILFVVILTLAGCGNSEKEINLENLANELMNEVKFDDELTQLDEKMIEKIYDIENAKKKIVYIGSGATAEEVALFEFDDENAADEGFKKIQERIKKQKEDYESYIPEEVSRLEQAIAEKEQKYVILCVTSDEDAKEIVQKYLE